MDQAEFQRSIKKFGKGYSALKKVLKQIPEKAWDFKPAKEEWSIREIIVHLVDSESNAMLRARVLYAESGRTLMAYDQDLWATKLDYSGANTKTSLQTLKWVRKFTYEWLQGLDIKNFGNTAKHPEYKQPYTFEKWLEIYSNHIYGHIDQINHNVEVWKRSKNKN